MMFLDLARRIKRTVFPPPPIPVFHHIPKCGGTSIRKALAQWWTVVPDYRPDDGEDAHYTANPIPLDSLQPHNCLSGHFARPEHYLHVRYPGIFGNKRFRLLTLLRDPLDAKCSLHRYSTTVLAQDLPPLEEFLLSTPNYLAYRLPVTDQNPTEALDRYAIVGVLERAQDFLDQIAELWSKPRFTLPHLNRTERKESTLPGSLVEEFRSLNTLDYALYHAALERAGQPPRL